MSVATTSLAAARGASRWLDRLLARPRTVLATLAAAQITLTLVLALRVEHNGWVYYQGGDQIWFTTSGWLLGGLELAPSEASYLWPLVQAPITLLTGPSYVNALPVLVLLNVLVLGPIALLCVYGIASRIGGRLLGYWAGLLWVLAPYAAIPLFVDRYHEKYVDQFLPHPLGLTAMADFAGMVALLVGAAFTVRAYQARDVRLAAIAGLAVGYAGLIKPSNLIFLPAPLIALAIGRRWRELAVGTAAFIPSLVALSVWKYKGYGYLPAFESLPQQHETRVALGTDTITQPYDKYINVDWHHLHLNLLGLGEVFWSVRVLQLLPFVGALAVARRAPILSVFLSVWFWVFFVVKGADIESSVDSGSFFRLLLPAIPALLLMVAAFPLLVPRYGPALAKRFPAAPPRRVSTWALVAAVVVLGIVPVAAAAAVSPLDGYGRAVVVKGLEIPVDPGLDVRATVDGRRVMLRWKGASQGDTALFYRVLRFRGTPDVTCPPREGAASQCSVVVKRELTTRGTSLVDRPGPGEWSYRVGVGANSVDDPRLGDIFLISPRVGVTLR
jgi:hypothetical protein